MKKERNAKNLKLFTISSGTKQKYNITYIKIILWIKISYTNPSLYK